MQKRWLLILATLIVFATTASVEGKRGKSSSDENDAQAEAMYLWPVKPPEGWFHNLEGSRKVGLQIMTPRPTDSDALLYVQASRKKQDVDRSIAESHENLLRSEPATNIRKMPDVERRNGEPAFQVYRYEVRGRKRQPLEYIAFGEARFSDGKFFKLGVTLTGNDPKAVENYIPLYRAFLAAH